jgi:hypothetical protein
LIHQLLRIKGLYLRRIRVWGGEMGPHRDRFWRAGSRGLQEMRAKKPD